MFMLRVVYDPVIRYRADGKFDLVMYMLMKCFEFNETLSPFIDISDQCCSTVAAFLPNFLKGIIKS